MIVRQYRKSIAEGWGVLMFASLFALAVRLAYYFSTNEISLAPTGNTTYLWDILSKYWDGNKLRHLMLGGITVTFMAILAHQINIKNSFIRNKTSLAPAMVLFLFSMNPSYLMMSHELISALIVLLAFRVLFAAYDNNSKQVSALNACFPIAICSLFDVSLILFFPVTWLSLSLVRSFGFKAFIASLFSIVVVYIPAFSYFCFADILPELFSPFLRLFKNIEQIPIFSINLDTWIILGLSTFIFVLVFINNFAASFRDKVKVRIYNTLLGIYISYAILLFLFVNVASSSFMYIALATASLILAHFYASVEDRWKVFLFIFQAAFFFTVCWFKYQVIL